MIFALGSKELKDGAGLGVRSTGDFDSPRGDLEGRELSRLDRLLSSSVDRGDFPPGLYDEGVAREEVDSRGERRDLDEEDEDDDEEDDEEDFEEDFEEGVVNEGTEADPFKRGRGGTSGCDLGDRSTKLALSLWTATSSPIVLSIASRWPLLSSLPM